MVPPAIQSSLAQCAAALHRLRAPSPSVWFIPVFVCIGTIFSAIIPPFQSPDEFDHLKAAYMLGQGELLMESRDGSSSGTMTDTGLEAFMGPFNSLPFHGDHKFSRSMSDAASTTMWSGCKGFSQAPTSANYFPLVYLPQCIGLNAGRAFGLTVSTSYYLARFCSLLAAALLLFAAFQVWNPSPLTLLLLSLPMSVFQFSSASLDGVTVAIAVLLLSLFLRMCRTGEVRAVEFFVLAGLAALLGTSRIHSLPLFAAVIFACCISRKWWSWTAAACAGILVLLWTAFTMRHNVDTRILHDGSFSGNFGFYISHPLEFPRILAATLAKPENLTFYGESYVGILGWLDTRFPSAFYLSAWTSLILVAVASAWSTAAGNLWGPRLLLLGASLLSVLLLFFALLVQWNSRPAETIEGIQGRYFLIPALMLSHALSAPGKPGEGAVRKAALLLFSGFACVAFFLMARVLIDRYYIPL